MKTKKIKLLLLDWRFLLSLIFLLALALRLWHLGSLPKVFFVDEVLSGYVGRYILENGVDIYNHPWPKLYFNNFGDYYIIGPMYLDGLSTKVFGLNEFAVRLPTAVIGAFLAPLMYLFSWLLFSKKRLALLAAFFVAISPWHIVLSRATTESVIETSLLVLVMSFLLLALKRSQSRWFLAAFSVSLLAYDTYHTARMLTPLIIFGFVVAWVLFSYRQTFNATLKFVWRNQKGMLLGWLTLFLFFSGLTFYISQTPWGKGRFDQTSIFSEQSGVSIRMTEMTYNLGSNKIWLARIFHNKLLGYGREFIHQYLSYLNPNYLLINGWQETRYAVPEAGPSYLTFGLLAIVGLVVSFQERYFQNWRAFLVIWLLFIAAIPASFTVIEAPNIRRSLFLLVPLVLLISAGSDFLFDQFLKIKNVFLRGFLFLSVGVVLLGEFIFFGYHYVFQSDLASAYYRRDGYKQVVEYVKANKDKVDKIFLPSREFLPVQYLFFTQNLNKEYARRFRPTAHIDSLENLIFIENDCPSSQLTVGDMAGANRVLVVDQPGCSRPESKDLAFKLIDQVYGVDKLLKFPVYEVEKKE